MLSSFSYSSFEEDGVSSPNNNVTQQTQSRRPYSCGLKVFPIVVFIVTIILYFWQIKMDAAVATSATSSTDFGSKKSFRVVLFGDSLINVPCEEFGLQMQIKYEINE